MRFLGNNFSLLGPATPLLHVLTLALAGLALAVTGTFLDTDVTILALVYCVFAAVSWLLLTRLDWQWLPFVTAVLDIAAIMALAILVSSIALPIWVLYLLVIANAATIGPIAAAAAAGLSGTGYLATTWLATGSVGASALWPVAVMLSVALLAIAPSAKLLVERRSKRAWQEIAASLRVISTTSEPEELASAIVEQVRHLVRANDVWLWLREDPHRPALVRCVGSPEGAISSANFQDFLTLAVSARLKRAPVPLSEMGEPFAGMAGEVIALYQESGQAAILATSWKAPPADLATRREQLRILAPSLAAALAGSRDLVVLRERMRREGILLQAASDLAATLDLHAAYETAVNVVRSEFGAAAAIVALPSGYVMVGDPETAEAVSRSVAVSQPSQSVPQDGYPQTGAADDLAVAIVGGGLAIASWRANSPFDEEETTWLHRLAKLLSASAKRCAEYERLRTEEQRLRSAIESLPAPCALWGPNGRLIVANKAFKALGISEQLPAATPAPNRLHQEELVVGDPPRTFVSMTSPVAQTQCVVSVLREITQEREALKTKDELIAMASHELRSPLTSISGYSQMMARQLAVVQRQVSQINSLIGDFLEASQLEGTELRLAAESIDLAELGRMAAERFQGSNEGRRLRLELGEVPLLQGDATRLAQVLDNLLSNAAKYSSSEAEIVLTLTSDERQVLASVRDHGVGIAPEHLPRLFDRFYRVRNEDTERVKGLGLGLSIVRDIVTAHRGQVWVESPGPGQGSTFRVSIPLPKGDQAGLPPEPAGTEA